MKKNTQKFTKSLWRSSFLAIAYLFSLKNFIIVKIVKIKTKDKSNNANLIFFCLKNNQVQIKLKNI